MVLYIKQLFGRFCETAAENGLRKFNSGDDSLAVIKPFCALRFTEKAGKLSELLCPPYDIISEDQRRNYLKRNPHNIIRLELPKEDAQAGESVDAYVAAGATLRSWLDEGILAVDSKPALYIYEEEFEALGGTHKIKGFTCRVALEEFSAGVVLPHEETLSKAKADRFDLMNATACNFSSIYSLYFDEDGSVYGMVDKMSEAKPDIEFTADDGVIQRLWAVTDEDAVSKICGLMSDKKLYIADGHHRYETALNYRKNVDGNADSVMMTLVNMENSGLVVYPTHRIVRGLEGFDVARLQSVLESSRQYFDISDCEAGNAQAELSRLASEGRKAYGMYAKGKLKLMVLRDGAVMQELLPQKSEAYRDLDVSILHTLILERLFGIDRENMANQKNLTYTRDISEAMEAVDSGGADCAFIINATRVDEIAAVAGAGEKMPQKSTYFYPKLITGLTMNRLLY